MIVSLLSFQSCNFHKEDKIDNYVKTVYLSSKKESVLDFNKLFDYDKMYIFEEGVTNEEVSKAIGFQYNGDKDISRLILFIKGKKIIYEQNLVFNDSESYKVFFITDEMYLSNKIKFSIEKDEDTFILKPIFPPR
jgi:hypothetical protein